VNQQAGLFVPFLNRFLHWGTVGMGTTITTLLLLSKGIPLETVGLVLALYSALVVVFEVPSGILSDRLGRQAVYLISLALQAAGYGLLCLVSDLAWLLVSFGLLGMARAFSSGSIDSLYLGEVLAHKGKDGLPKLVSAMTVGEAAGLALGALVGGLIPLVWALLFPNDNKYNGVLVAQVLVLAVLAVLTVLTWRPETQPEEKVPLRRFVADGLRFVRSNRIVSAVLLGSLFWRLSMSALEVYWQPRLKDLLRGDEQTWAFGLLNSGYFLAAMLGALVITRFLKGRNPGSLVLIGVLRVAMGLAFVVLAFQHEVATFAVFYLSTLLFNGMLGVPESTAVNAELPDAQRSSLLSFWSLTVQAGGIFGLLVFSALKVWTDIGVIWMVAGAVLTLSAWFYFRSASRQPPTRVDHGSA